MARSMAGDDDVRSVLRDLFCAVVRKTWQKERAFALFARLSALQGWHTAVRVAVNLRVVPMFYRAVAEWRQEGGEAIPEEAYRVLQDRAARVIERCDILLELASSISEQLGQEEITHAVLKGPWTQVSMYGLQQRRQFSDIDVLLSREDLRALGDVLGDLGFICGKYDHSQRRIIPHSRATRFRQMLLFSHPAIYRKIHRTADGHCHILLVEPHHDICWPGRGGVRLPPIPTPFLLSKRELARHNGKVVWGLDPVRSLICLCVSIYKDANSILNIRDGTDCRLCKLCDVHEYVLSGDCCLASVWRLAREYRFEQSVELVAKYLQILYGSSLLWDVRPPSYVKQCDVDAYGLAAGFEHAAGGQWRQPLEKRLFDPERYMEVAERVRRV